MTDIHQQCHSLKGPSEHYSSANNRFMGCNVLCGHVWSYFMNLYTISYAILQKHKKHSDLNRPVWRLTILKLKYQFKIKVSTTSLLTGNNRNPMQYSTL